MKMMLIPYINSRLHSKRFIVLSRTYASRSPNASRSNTRVRRLAERSALAGYRNFVSPISRQQQQQQQQQYLLPQKRIHSSARKQKSSTALNMEESASLNMPHHVTIIPKPSLNALKTLFITSAIPMIGFGFMDNVVMIQAGQYIDRTIGVQLGLATLTAAACGQVVSDVSGVVFGGTLERFLTRLSLIKPPDLTTAQRQLSLCRNVSLLGAVLGVITGCALGATTLLFMDLEARERMHRATQLRDIVEDMMKNEREFPCDNTVVYLVHRGNASQYDVQSIPGSANKSVQLRELYSDVSEKATPMSLADQCRQEKRVVCDALRQNMCAPIIKDDQVMVVIQWHHKAMANIGSKSESESEAPGFTLDHVKVAKYVARHIGIFMDHLID